VAPSARVQAAQERAARTKAETGISGSPGPACVLFLVQSFPQSPSGKQICADRRESLERADHFECATYWGKFMRRSTA
jgi:hypothetical protein